LVIVASHSAATDLFAKNAVFLNQVLDDGLLMPVLPTRYRYEQKGNWIQTTLHGRNVAHRTSDPLKSISWTLRHSSFASALPSLMKTRCNHTDALTITMM
jgi:hypothetical protein